MNTLAFLAGSITTAAAGTVGALLLPQRPPHDWGRWRVRNPGEPYIGSDQLRECRTCGRIQGHWWNGMTRCYYREGEEWASG